MEWQNIYWLANMAILGGFTLIRIPYILQSIGQASTTEDKKRSIIYGIISALMVLVGFLYLFFPLPFTAFSIDFPQKLRVLGILIGVIGDALLLWTHQALDKNFAMYVASTINHQLVTSGPYAWVRHPMYTAFLLISLGFFLVSSNLFFGAFTACIIYPLIYRMQIEEIYLVKTFGKAYTAYQKQTKRLIPFIY